MDAPEIDINLDDIFKVVQHDTTNKLINYLQEQTMDDFDSIEELVESITEKASTTYTLLLRQELNKQIDRAITIHLNRD